MANGKEGLKEFLLSKNVLIRVNLLLLSYIGWVTFGMLYSILGRWSVNLTPYLLKLPFTSRNFVLSLYSAIRGVPILYKILEAVYYIGFSGAIAFESMYLLVLKRDLKIFDRLLVTYTCMYLISGASYVLFHVYAPHVVYGLEGYPGEGFLTRKEFVFPSLHNAFAMANILILWGYRREPGALLLIILNALVPPSTLLLAHHWIYDVLSGFLVATLAFKASMQCRIQTEKYLLETKTLLKVTLIFSIMVVVTIILSFFPIVSHINL